MNRYVIVCSCGNPSELATWFEPLSDGGHVIAVVDGDHITPNYFPGNPPRGGFGFSLKPNRFGERRDPLALRCPGGCRTKVPRIGMSTAVLAVRRVVHEATKNGVELPEVDVLDGKLPRTPEDAELCRRQVEAALFGEVYDAPEPDLIQQFSRRTVIPFLAFAKAVSYLPKHRLRDRPSDTPAP